MRGKIGVACREPRCSEIVTGSGTYCNRHRPGKWTSNQGGGERERLAFYSSARWEGLRRLKLNKDPICEVCRNRFASQVHHLKKAREFPELRFEMSNLQSICVWCHAKETQKETTETFNANRRKVD